MNVRGLLFDASLPVLAVLSSYRARSVQDNDHGADLVYYLSRLAR